MADDKHLIEQVALATRRETRARAAFEVAREEVSAAGEELRGAWTALRDHQDEQVRAALEAAPPVESLSRPPAYTDRARQAHREQFSK